MRTAVRVSPRAAHRVLVARLTLMPKPTTPLRVFFSFAVWLAVSTTGLALIFGLPVHVVIGVTVFGTVGLVAYAYLSASRLIGLHVAAAKAKVDFTEKVGREQLVQGYAFLAMVENTAKPEKVTELREAIERFEIVTQIRGIEARESVTAVENFARGRMADQT